jgi:hypothetical protein
MRRRRAPCPSEAPSCAGNLNDLHVYDPATEAWTNLSAALSGTPPSFRYHHGFTSAGDKLYVHGGSGGSGGEGRGGAGCAEDVGMGGHGEGWQAR